MQGGVTSLLHVCDKMAIANARLRRLVTGERLKQWALQSQRAVCVLGSITSIMAGRTRKD